MQKYVIIDTETTGLDAEKHEIVSFGGIVLIDHKIVETIEIKIKPAHIDTADQKALEINGYSPDKWQYANTQKEGAYKIADFIERHRDKIFAGHNLQFDIKFIQALGKNQNVYMSIPAMYPYIDTRDLCRSMLSGYGLSRCTWCCCSRRCWSFGPGGGRRRRASPPRRRYAESGGSRRPCRRSAGR